MPEMRMMLQAAETAGGQSIVERRASRPRAHLTATVPKKGFSSPASWKKYDVYPKTTGAREGITVSGCSAKIARRCASIHAKTYREYRPAVGKPWVQMRSTCDAAQGGCGCQWVRVIAEQRDG